MTAKKFWSIGRWFHVGGDDMEKVKAVSALINDAETIKVITDKARKEILDKWLFGGKRSDR